MVGMNPSVQKYLSKMERPIPGQSLSEDPDSPAPYVAAPEFTVPKEAMEYIWHTLTSEDIYKNVMTSVAQGAAIMEVTQLVLFGGFTEGKWNPDLMLMLMEPTAYMIMALSEKAGIDYVIEAGDELESSEDDESALDISQAPEEIKELVSQLDTKEMPSLMGQPETAEPLEEEAQETAEPQQPSLMGRK
tara:strand:+ start:201 stop:767 length:567 start_codon:yes stop_codon:yes gene_type:complete